MKIFRGSLVFIILLLLCISSVFAQTKNLDYFINSGLANSPLLKDYQNQVIANSIDSQRLQATFKPQVTGISYNSFSPVVNGVGYDQALTNIASFNELVNVSQSFIGKENLTTQYKGLQLLSSTYRNAQKLSEQELKRNITSQYITAYGDLQQLNFYTEVNRILINQGIILKRLTESNIYRQTDYLTFIVTMKQQELQLKQLKIQYRNDFAMLNYLCGLYDTSEQIIEDPGMILQQLPDTATSEFFLHFRNNSLILENEMKVLDLSYRPKVNAFANAGYSSSFLYHAYDNFGIGMGINMNVPIFDWHQRKMQQQKIKLLENTNSTYKDLFTVQHDQQIAMLRQQLVSTESLIVDINDQIKYAEGLIQVNGKLLETGDAKIADLVIALNNYLTAKNLLTQNTISRMQIINQINYWNR